jgi:hypothetical protein
LISNAPIVDFETADAEARSFCSKPASARAARQRRGVRRKIIGVFRSIEKAAFQVQLY